MTGDRSRLLVDTVRRLLRRGAHANLRKIVNKSHAGDLSVVFRAIGPQERNTLFSMLEDLETKGTLLSESEGDALLRLVETLSVDELVGILETLASDDAADIIGQLPEELSQAVLKKMSREGSQEIEGLLGYEDDTAGGIMVTDFVAVSENDTARQVIESLQREHHDVEMPFYLYVVDDNGRLTGVSSLRQLVVHAAETPIRDFMTRDVLSVRTDMDQEEVARIVARYDILAVPVVDADNKLVGIITVDDVIDIIREEATEDILKMAGVGEEFVETQSFARSTRIRAPWLFASCMGGILASLIISHFSVSLQKVAYLAAFIPVIMGMGGNVGTQSSTIVVRGLATGRLQVSNLWKVLFKELRVGVTLGILYGAVVGFVAHLGREGWALSLAVGLAMICSMSLAAVVGSVLPLGFARVHIDPAVATGPFVTTSVDVLSVFFYFEIATMLLGI
ncbi:MAG: magnesium transporter [Thermodesulfobacteriota bacterium]